MPVLIRNKTGDSGLTTPQREKDTLGWAHEAVQEGQAYLEAQPNYDKISETIDQILNDRPALKTKLSRTSANYFGKIADDLVALLTDARPFWEYKTHNEDFSKQAVDLGHLSEHWWINKLADMRFADVVRHCLTGGSGFAHMTWSVANQDIQILAEDARDVLPVRNADNVSIQSGVGVIVRRERPVSYIESLYPRHKGLIVAEKEGTLSRFDSTRTVTGRIYAAINRHSPFSSTLFGDQEGARAKLKLPTSTLYTFYFKDDSVAERDEQIGPPGYNWSYVVRKGEKRYPRGRVVVFVGNHLLSDGPNIYWHGLFPVPKLCLNPWPQSWIGKSPMWDALPLQRSLDRLLRVVDDHADQVAEPSFIADKNAMSRSAFEEINTRAPGQRYLHNPALGKAFELWQPNPLDPTIPQQILWLIETMRDVTGVRDLSQLANLGQIPTAETVEKIQETMSPSNRLRSRQIEAFMREFALMLASNFIQFYTESQRLAVLGSDGQQQYYDYDPRSMVPSMPGHSDYDPGLPRSTRASNMMRNLTYQIAPGSLLNSSKVSRNMLFLQLARAGMVDHWTLLEQLDVPNVGKPPADPITGEIPTSISDRLILEARMGLGMNISPVGRKASGQQSPRVTVKES